MLERANFLAIFASNLDEFFMVRVAGLKRRIITGLAVPTNMGRTPHEVLTDVSHKAHELQTRHAAAYQDVKPRLAEAGIRVVVGRARRDEREHLRTTSSRADLPGAHAARGRPGPSVPLHLGALAQPLGARAQQPHRPPSSRA